MELLTFIQIPSILCIKKHESERWSINYILLPTFKEDRNRDSWHKFGYDWREMKECWGREGEKMPKKGSGKAAEEQGNPVCIRGQEGAAHAKRCFALCPYTKS